MAGRRAWIWIFILVVIALYIAFRAFAAEFIRWAWLGSLNLHEVFWRTLTARWETGCVAGLLFGLFVWVNLRLAVPSFAAPGPETASGPYSGWLQARRANRVALWGAIVIGLLAGWILSSQWSTLWFAHNAVPFGISDPIFGRDIADYVFRLPAYELAYHTAGAAFWIAGLAVLAIYFATGWLNFLDGHFQVHPRTRAHLAGLLAAYLALKAVGYRLGAWNLMYSQRGFVPGPGYADMHAALPALRILMVVAIVAALLAAWAAIRRSGLIWWALGGLVGCSLLLGTVYPAVVENLVVRPSQLSRELPYIENDIAATRHAFDLDAIDLEPFQVTPDLTAANLAPYQDTFQNIRLWDWQIASPAFQQLQGLRAYYTFDPVTIDRYTVQGQYRQVLVAAREINYSALPESTWVNEHLKFTHGFGTVVVPASEIGDQGNPVFWMENIDNSSSVGLQITQPRIYYGEATTTYAIVGPQISEFDHPLGQADAYNQYDGAGGIPIGGAFSRLAFSLWAGNYNPIFSSYIGKGSKALINRSLGQMLPAILNQPFLTYDRDPYIVLAGGRLYWIIDGYTTSSAYPYAQAAAGTPVNYMRNAVKVVVDAYNGSVTYYVADPTDPIIQTEERIFPGVFQPLSAMPSDLRSHLRYPEDMFSTQAQVYTTYHMTDPTVFYNKEDKWNVANEIAGGNASTGINAAPSFGFSSGSGAGAATASNPIPPYYVILQFPGMSAPQFVLMEPFTPIGASRDNMAAWLTAFSDGSNYGKLVAYEFPKEQNVIGPLQVESQINQDSDIASLLTLWTRGGSQVARGNLLVIPIRNSFLYVEPLYQIASSTQLPALRRVIVDYGGQQLAVGTTLDDALTQIFGSLPWAPNGGQSATGNQNSGQPATGPSTGTSGTTGTPSADLAAALTQAESIYQQAQKSLKAGDFTGYASQIEALGQVLSSATGAAPASGGSAASGGPAASGASGSTAGAGTTGGSGG